MSIGAMSQVAFLSRTDVDPVDYVPKTMPELAGAANGKPTPENAVNTALQMIVTYVPTEVLTLYVAVLGAIQDPAAESFYAQWVAFLFFLVATPAIVWLVYAAKVKNAGKPVPLAPRKWPHWEMAAATIAYVAWAFALPESPFNDAAWYSAALAGVIVMTASVLLSLLAPLFQHARTP
jgi:RsiW-degrading membrane proteinase PrsW (M82 family)